MLDAPVTLTPVTVSDGLLVMRSPRLSDGPAWSKARLANRQWLERAFPACGEDWEAEQSPAAWAQRWWRLRRLARSGRATPFVVTLDGALIGELGVDAVDEASGAGEISSWRIRSHGSSAVMYAASLLLLEHAFTGPVPMSRVLSPVATSSRRGRSPGLQAVGYEIAGTLPRKVGAAGLVDHDMWVVYNTDERRRTLDDELRPLRAAAPHGRGAAPRPTSAHRRAAATAAARAAVREGRAAVRRTRSSPARQPAGQDAASRVPVADGRTAVLGLGGAADLEALGAVGAVPSDAVHRDVRVDRQLVAVLSHRDDPGTAVTEVFAVARADAGREVLSVAAAALLDELRPTPDEVRVLVVRVPDRTSHGIIAPDAEMLTGLGLERAVSYSDSSDDEHEWSGEDIWRMPATS